MTAEDLRDSSGESPQNDSDVTLSEYRVLSRTALENVPEKCSLDIFPS